MLAHSSLLAMSPVQVSTETMFLSRAADPVIAHFAPVILLHSQSISRLMR